MTEAGDQPTRRAVLAAGGAVFLAGCSAERGTEATGVTSPAATTAAQPAPTTAATAASTGPAHDPQWVAVENAKPGATDWRIPHVHEAGEHELAGYTDRVSAVPGEVVDLHLSSTLGPVTVRALRLGYYGGRGAREVWTSAPLTAGRQPAPATDRLGMVRCAWAVATTLDTTGWPEGSYLLRLEARGKARYVPLTIRSATTAGRVVLLSAVTCYQAYNLWGGRSLYEGPDGTFATRAFAVSFDRPYDRSGAQHVLNYERGAIAVAESLGIDLAYATSVDLHADPRLLDGAHGIVSLGHDEYWTLPMRRHVEAARDAGTNVAFLGANAVYWRVRLADGGRTMTCYKSADLDPVQGPHTTTHWRGKPDSWPENSLTGMLYEAFPAQADLVVHDPRFFLFAGTGARRGSRYGGLVAIEIDRAYPVAGTPGNLQVVAHSPVPQFQKPDTHSDMTYYTTASGAGVFAVGTMAWCVALRGPRARRDIDARAAAFARSVTSTLLREMAQGPLGRRHPARGNLAALGASPSTSTGTGGPVAT